MYGNGLGFGSSEAASVHAAFEGIARGNRGESEEARRSWSRAANRLRIETRRDSRQRIEQPARGAVLRRLQVGVHLIVARVEFLGRRTIAPGRCG